MPAKGFLIVLKKKYRGKDQILVSLLHYLEILGTYVKQRQCYEVFAIHHDLIYEPFNSCLSSAMSQEAFNITVR